MAPGRTIGKQKHKTKSKIIIICKKNEIKMKVRNFIYVLKNYTYSFSQFSRMGLRQKMPGLLKSVYDLPSNEEGETRETCTKY